MRIVLVVMFLLAATVAALQVVTIALGVVASRSAEREALIELAQTARAHPPIEGVHRISLSSGTGGAARVGPPNDEAPPFCGEVRFSDGRIVAIRLLLRDQ